MMKSLSILVTLALVSLTSMAFAQDKPVAAGAAAQNVITITPPPSKTPAIILGFKSTIDSGRAGTIYKDEQRTSKSKNELFAGYRNSEGWGSFLNGVQTYTTVNDTNKKNDTKTRWSYGDPSITLLHPDFFESPTLSVFGQFRYYIPTTFRSNTQDINQFAYYLRSNSRIASGQEIYNEVIPRYFSYSSYKAKDTAYLIEDTTIYNYRLSKSWKIGTKSWAQYEVHKGTSPGFSLEAGPQVVYSFNSNLSIAPSISFPLAAKNEVFDGPKSVTTDDAYLNIFIQARL